MHVYLQEKEAQQLANTMEFPHNMALSVALRKVKHARIDVSALTTRGLHAYRKAITAHYFS